MLFGLFKLGNYVSGYESLKMCYASLNGASARLFYHMNIMWGGIPLPSIIPAFTDSICLP